jgi:hypothetical protein
MLSLLYCIRHCTSTLQGKSHLCTSFLGIARPQSQFGHMSVSDLYIPRIGPHIFLQQKRQTNPRNYINLSQIHECLGDIGRHWETEHYNSVLEIKVSFLGIYKRE